ncbi:MAG: hypothetical protein LBI63_01275 [Candidatus Ancillula sp.]|jgi:hypothetical protein|nr:hypothetical protein [Candidatus Ancillula sp.]
MTRKSLNLFFVLAFSAMFLSVSLSGCSNLSKGSLAPKTTNLDESHFTGPYASEIYQLYKMVKSESVAKLIEDSDISEQDINDVNNMFSECMKPKGWKYVVEKGKDLQVSPTDENKNPNWDKESQDEASCNAETNFSDVQILYNTIHSNPEKLDRSKIIVECLIKMGTVPNGYTVDEYKYDSGAVDQVQHGVFEEASKGKGETSDIGRSISVCQNNPLGLNF